MNDTKLRDAMILTIEDPLDRKVEQMIALQEDCKKMIDDLCNDGEIDEIVRKLRSAVKLQNEISELLAKQDEPEEIDDRFTCRDCGKKFNKEDEEGNEKYCLRCEANWMAQKNYDHENGHNDQEE